MMNCLTNSDIDNNLPPESEEDHIEYKRKLSYDMLENIKVDNLVTQIKWRVKEGGGNATYYLGVNDNGTIYGLDRIESKETLNVFKIVVQKADVEIVKINRINYMNKMYYKIEIKEKSCVRPELRILVIGPEKSGKSTFVSGLVHKQADNGNGYLRNMLVSHKHELYSGKLNSVNIKTFDSTDYNITLIDTPANIIENKIYLTKLIEVCNYCFVLFNSNHTHTQINQYIDILIKNNLSYDIVQTHVETNSSHELNLLTKIPDDFITSKINLFRLFDSNNLNNNNQTMILTKLYSGECLYLLICIQISGLINLNDNIIFDTDGISGRVESIQYMGCSHTCINQNITFTCFIKTEQIIKKLKGEIFYSI